MILDRSLSNIVEIRDSHTMTKTVGIRMMPIQFILNDQEIRTDLPPGTPLLDFIRYDRRLTGTKIGCREGDCGACTILVGEIAPEGMQYKSMTSCIMPLGNARGKHIVTVEGLNLPELNPVQKAIVEEGATQCGFCTVGFVVSLAGFCLSRKAVTVENAIAAMDGNICRCTGYKSLERVAERLVGVLSARDDGEPISWLADHAFLPPYFPGILERLKRVKAEIAENTDRTDGPADMNVGGGTDLLVQRPDDAAAAAVNLLYDRPELKGIRCADGICHVGGGTTFEALGDSEVMRGLFPRMDAIMHRIASTPIRNMATLAGNIVNASPIGDMTIFFLALGATVVLREGETSREVPLRALYRGYKKLDKTPGELVESVHFTMPGENHRFNFEKVSKRTCLDIASVNSAACVEVDDGTITAASISAGGVAPIPLFLDATTTFLEGRPVEDAVIKEAGEIARGEVVPISDARGSAEYKRLLLRQLVYAHFLTWFPDRVHLEALL